MEKEDIRINKAIVHILDSALPIPVLSDALLDSGTDFSDFLRSHIYRILSSDEKKQCQFNQEDSPVLRELQLYTKDNFVAVSKNLAVQLFGIMNANIAIPPADLVFVSFTITGQLTGDEPEELLALLKMNFKSSYTHFTLDDVTGNHNSIVLQKAILPSEGQKLSEAVIIHLSDYSLEVIERRYEVNGTKVNYLTSLFLQCHGALSPKTRLDIVVKAVEAVQEKFDETHFEKKMETKSIINTRLAEQGALNIPETVKEIFRHSPQMQQEFESKIEKYNILDDEIIPRNPATTKKYEKQFLTTDTGIEIKIPMEQYNNPENIEFITNTDGTISVLIKNIGNISTK